MVFIVALCALSAHYARLVHVGWTQCGHGLSSRPRESCDILLMHPLLSFFFLVSGRGCIGALSWQIEAPLHLYSLLQEDSYLDPDFQCQWETCG